MLADANGRGEWERERYIERDNVDDRDRAAGAAEVMFDVLSRLFENRKFF